MNYDEGLSFLQRLPRIVMLQSIGRRVGRTASLICDDVTLMRTRVVSVKLTRLTGLPKILN